MIEVCTRSDKQFPISVELNSGLNLLTLKAAQELYDKLYDALDHFVPEDCPQYDRGGCEMKPTKEQVLKAVYESGLHQYAPQVLDVKWKDGIDIDVPSGSLMNFVGKIVHNTTESSK